MPPTPHVHSRLPWRSDHVAGRTVYDATGRPIGVMDTREDALALVLAVNNHFYQPNEKKRNA
jgi:hypothetical protein